VLSGRPRLALFDLDNTLIDRDAAFHRWAREYLAVRGADDDFGWLVELDASGYCPREVVFAALRERFGDDEPLDQRWARYNERMAQLVTIRPAVLAALDRMRAAGWRVGIVTNGVPRGQLAKVTAVGLLDHVDACVVSGAEGFHKPDVRLFEIASQRCGVSLVDGGWMVGDTRHADIWGGAQAGLRTIWIRSASAPAGVEPDHVVDDVLAAFEILGRVEL
jgi:HAD superfamily hydrolase (TIGR01549 family)